MDHPSERYLLRDCLLRGADGIVVTMDPETERQLAAMIMEEANRLRLEVERDGVAAYLAKPKIRGRANQQFLQATVRSIQQSNKIVEVNEMWRRRNVELEYERERNSRWRRDGSPGEQSDHHGDSSSKRHHRHDSDTEDVGDGGLKDEELEQFLHSRLKRGRGAIGSRMDETGPYLPSQADMKGRRRALMPDERTKDEWEERIVGRLAGPSVQVRDWDRENWKRTQRDSSVEEAVDEELHARRTTERKEKKPKKERALKRDSKRDSRTKKRQKLEKSSKRRR